MKTFIINTISDSEGIKQVFTCDGISKLWYGQWYEFNREIKQISRVKQFVVEADGFNHALDKIRFDNYKKQSQNDYKTIFNRLKTIESKVLQKFGKKLKGKADKSKINSFLR